MKKLILTLLCVLTFNILSAQVYSFKVTNVNTGIVNPDKTVNWQGWVKIDKHACMDFTNHTFTINIWINNCYATFYYGKLHSIGTSNTYYMYKGLAFDSSQSPCNLDVCISMSYKYAYITVEYSDVFFMYKMIPVKLK